MPDPVTSSVSYRDFYTHDPEKDDFRDAILKGVDQRAYGVCATPEGLLAGVLCNDDTAVSNACRTAKPGTTVDVIERCSGHNGTYAVKKEFRAASVKIGRPVMTRVESAQPAYYTSDCPMAGHQIESGLENASPPTHPLTLLRMAYGLETTR